MNPYRDLADDDLLAQCEVELRRASGPGGQHRNKVESAVRLIHRPTGVVANATERRSQHANRALALERLREKLEVRFHVDAPRHKTRKPRGVRRREVEEKRQESVRKRLRRPPGSDE